ncbi:MAG: iron complex outermembrane receptor protein [Halieaceae bacterium]
MLLELNEIQSRSELLVFAPTLDDEESTMTNFSDSNRATFASLVAKPLSLAVAVVVASEAQYASAEGLQLEEVLVTAQRKEESLQTTPVSISAFSKDEVDLMVTVNDVILATPNLAGGRQIANSMATTYFLRGVGQDDANTLADPAVGFYVDDIYFARQVANNSYLYDIERIEVLRGPQGILYGRNTTGGAVKVVTVKPDNTFAANGEFAVGNYSNQEFRGSINVPIADGFYSRISAYSQKRDGFIDNITLGEDSDDVDNWGARLALRIEGGDALTVDFTASIQNSDTSGTTSSNLLRPETGQDLFVTESGFENPYNRVQEVRADATATYVGSAFTFKSITAYAETEWDFSLDFGGSPLPIFVLANDITSRQFSQEFNLSSTIMDGRLDLTGGLFAFTETSDNGELSSLFGATVELFKEYEHTTNAYALYGQAVYRLTERLGLTFGLRATREDRKISSITQFLGNPLTGDATPLWNATTLESLGIPTQFDQDDISPKVGFQYEFSEDIFFFGSYTEGFKSASWNQRASAPADFKPFKPETVQAYEIGVKSFLFDRRMSLNVSAFLNQYDDFIVNQINSDTGEFITTNAAEVEVKGLEIETSIRLLDNLDLIASVGVMDGEYTALDPGVPFTTANDPKFVPDLTANIALRYGVWSGPAGSLDLNADFYYSDRYYVGLQNFESEHAPKIEIFNLSLVYAVGVDRNWKITAFCRNCSDEDYFVSTLAAGAIGFETQIAAPPRVYGVRVGFDI